MSFEPEYSNTIQTWPQHFQTTSWVGNRLFHIRKCVCILSSSGNRNWSCWDRLSTPSAFGRKCAYFYRTVSFCSNGIFYRTLWPGPRSWGQMKKLCWRPIQSVRNGRLGLEVIPPSSTRKIENCFFKRTLASLLAVFGTIIIATATLVPWASTL